MYVIKRDGSQVHFDAYKICEAISKANNAYEGSDKLSPKMIDEIVEKINYKCSKLDRAVSVEEIQDMVEDCIMGLGRYRLAKEYITYRYKHALMRKSNDLDRKIINLIDCKNEEVLQENSNKNPTINSTQRDYIAGEYSKDISNRLLLPEDIQKAHNEGLIHFHDMDYFIQKMHNCCLINLEDMLQNGTVISETKIDTPHSFTTACNIATQIIAQVASSQYGGATISLAHLAPFVDVSRKKIINNIKEELEISDATLTEEQIKEIAEERLKREIKSGIQTIQYQIVTLMTTNGQAPFITESMYLNEAKNEQEKHDLAMIIEETLRQRYKGTKNKQGVYVTPTFPKLIYVLQDDNIHEGDEYYYLTIMAAQCTAKRMVPDYISEKKMKELKEGTVVIPMGAVFGKEVITYKLNNQLFVESFERAWDRLVSIYGGSMIKLIGAKSEFIVPENMLIFDSSSNGFVKVKKFIRNDDYNRWNRVKFNGRVLTLTSDHPLPTQRGRIAVEDLKPGDRVLSSIYQYGEIKDDQSINEELSWLLGLILCDGNYDNGKLSITFGLDEKDIADKAMSVMEKNLGLKVNLKEWNRGEKGNYLEVFSYNTKFCNYLESIFEGRNKINRHIPNIVFSSFDINKKYAFLSGMMDADGYFRKDKTENKMHIGSTNKELAIQQLLLGNLLNLTGDVYPNFYKGSQYKDKIRYRIDLYMDSILENYLASNKKIIANKNIPVRPIKMEYTVESVEFLGNIGEYEYDVETESDRFDVSGINSHNCRSMLSPWKDENGDYKYWGRFNMGVVTLNIPYVALSSKGDKEVFWKKFDEALELVHKALLVRYNRLKGTTSDYAPILWQHGALSRLKPGETIDKLLVGGYATISLGYAGLYEAVRYMTGKSHTDPEATPFALDIMKRMNEKCKEWKEKENLGYAIYGTPLESTTYKFAKANQRRFGVIEGVTDKPYVTNSYHVHVTEPISIFDKFNFESQFQELSTGGAISYGESPSMLNNVEAIMKVLSHIYDHILYAEINSKSDYCYKCGYEGEIKLDKNEETGEMVWTCPNCGNHDPKEMSIVRRTCGYLGNNMWNYGRTNEIHDRVLHL